MFREHMLLYFLFLLSIASFSGALYIIYKKIPVLVQIPLESLKNQETFSVFLSRIFKTVFSYIHLHSAKIFLLEQLARVLHFLHLGALKIHVVTGALTKKTQQKAQKMEWEFHWFSKKEMEKKNKE